MCAYKVGLKPSGYIAPPYISFKEYLNNSKYSDKVFVADGEKFYAHKVFEVSSMIHILTSHSFLFLVHLD
jgi:hypothetical protein